MNVLTENGLGLNNMGCGRISRIGSPMETVVVV